MRRPLSIPSGQPYALLQCPLAFYIFFKVITRIQPYAMTSPPEDSERTPTPPLPRLNSVECLTKKTTGATSLGQTHAPWLLENLFGGCRIRTYARINMRQDVFQLHHPSPVLCLCWPLCAPSFSGMHCSYASFIASQFRFQSLS